MATDKRPLFGIQFMRTGVKISASTGVQSIYRLTLTILDDPRRCGRFSSPRRRGSIYISPAMAGYKLLTITGD
jgi:hypothetical protein